MVSSPSGQVPSGPSLLGEPSSPKRFSNALVDVHGSYRSGRQAHEPPDELISDEVTPRVLRPHLVRSSFFFSAFVLLLLGMFLCMFLTMVIGIVEADSFSGQQGGSGAAAFFGGLAILLFLALLILMMVWAVALFMPVSEPIAEYGLLIEGRAQAAPAAYWWIKHTVAQRQTPFGVRPGRVQGTPVMFLTNRKIRGMIVVRVHGEDLYMGWTMWRARSTIVILGNLIVDMFSSAGIGSLRAAVRVASSRAMRELIHSVTREGVQAAILGPPVADEVARAELERLPNLDLPNAPAASQPVGSWPAPPQPPVPQHQQYSPVSAAHVPQPTPGPDSQTANPDTRP